MKFLIALALCFCAVLAAPQFEDPDHYAQHSQSVSAARHGASARLENFGGNTQSVVVPSEELCGLCESAGQEASDISQTNGVGYVVPVSDGETSSSGSEFSSSSHGASVPVVLDGGSSGSSQFSSSSSSQTENVASAPVVIPVGGSGSETYSSHSESESRQSSPVVQQVISYPSGGSETYSRSEKVVSSGSSVPVVPVVYPSGGGSERYSQSSFSETSGGVPIASYPSGSEYSSSSHSERVQQALPVHVPIYPTGGASSRYSSSQYKQVSQANPTIVVPISGGGHSVQTASRFSETRSTPSTQFVITPISSGGSSHKTASYRESHTSRTAPQIVYTAPAPQSSFSERYSQSSSSLAAQPSIVPVIPSGGSSHYAHSERFSNQGSGGFVAPVVSYPSGSSLSSRFSESSTLGGGFVAPVAPIVTYPAGGSSSARFSEHSSSSLGGGLVAPIVSYPAGGSSSSRFSEQSSSSLGGGYVAPVVTYPAGGSSSARFSEHSSSSLGGGLVAPVVSYPAGGSASSRFSEHSSSSGGFGGGTGLNYIYPSGHSNLASRFGSDFDSSSFGSSNLGHYMSESERLARLQAQNIQSSNGYKSTLAVNGGNVHYVAPASGGQTKSWEKSSKWSSQSEFDHTGQKKSSSYLSTAEGEDQTVNGHSTGFRAATTTVEDDGKRSTYSIHTP